MKSWFSNIQTPTFVKWLFNFEYPSYDPEQSNTTNAVNIGINLANNFSRVFYLLNPTLALSTLSGSLLGSFVETIAETALPENHPLRTNARWLGESAQLVSSVLFMSQLGINYQSSAPAIQEVTKLDGPATFVVNSVSTMTVPQSNSLVSTAFTIGVAGMFTQLVLRAGSFTSFVTVSALTPATTVGAQETATTHEEALLGTPSLVDGILKPLLDQIITEEINLLIEQLTSAEVLVAVIEKGRLDLLKMVYENHQNKIEPEAMLFALNAAIKSKNNDAIQFLKNTKNKIYENTFELFKFAATHDSFVFLETCKNLGFDIKQGALMAFEDTGVNLDYSIKEKMLQFAIKLKCNPNIPYQNGYTVLHLAAKNKFHSMIELLLQNKAYMYADFQVKVMPAALSLYAEDVEGLAIFLSYGSDPSIVGIGRSLNSITDKNPNLAKIFKQAQALANKKKLANSPPSTTARPSILSHTLNYASDSIKTLAYYYFDLLSTSVLGIAIGYFISAYLQFKKTLADLDPQRKTTAELLSQLNIFFKKHINSISCRIQNSKILFEITGENYDLVPCTLRSQSINIKNSGIFNIISDAFEIAEGQKNITLETKNTLTITLSPTTIHELSATEIIKKIKKSIRKIIAAEQRVAEKITNQNKNFTAFEKAITMTQEFTQSLQITCAKQLEQKEEQHDKEQENATVVISIEPNNIQTPSTTDTTTLTQDEWLNTIYNALLTTHNSIKITDTKIFIPNFHNYDFSNFTRHIDTLLASKIEEKQTLAEQVIRQKEEAEKEATTKKEKAEQETALKLQEEKLAQEKATEQARWEQEEQKREQWLKENLSPEMALYAQIMVATTSEEKSVKKSELAKLVALREEKPEKDCKEEISADIQDFDNNDSTPSTSSSLSTKPSTTSMSTASLSTESSTPPKRRPPPLNISDDNVPIISTETRIVSPVWSEFDNLTADPNCPDVVRNLLGLLDADSPRAKNHINKSSRDLDQKATSDQILANKTPIEQLIYDTLAALMRDNPPESHRVARKTANDKRIDYFNNIYNINKLICLSTKLAGGKNEIFSQETAYGLRKMLLSLNIMGNTIMYPHLKKIITLIKNKIPHILSYLKKTITINIDAEEYLLGLTNQRPLHERSTTYPIFKLEEFRAFLCKPHRQINPNFQNILVLFCSQPRRTAIVQEKTIHAMFATIEICQTAFFQIKQDKIYISDQLKKFLEICNNPVALYEAEYLNVIVEAAHEFTSTSQPLPAMRFNQSRPSRSTAVEVAEEPEDYLGICNFLDDDPKTELATLAPG